MIGVIDYGAGNLLSVKKALEYLDAECRIIQTADGFNGIEKIILPGVGAFKSAIEMLKSKKIFDFIKNWIIKNKPFLGICLGMQVLFEGSEETEGVNGFGLFRGKVRRFTKFKVPQIGWNQVKKTKEVKLTNNIKDDSFFYFLHGYFVDPEDEDIIVGVTEYGVDYPSAIAKGNIYAVQFHPEKSGPNGLKLIDNWLRKC